MSQHWPTVSLASVLRRSDETVAIEPEAEYQEITVRLWGKGVVRRGSVTGAELAASRRFRARAGHFVLSRIDARNGALGIVPKELDGAIVSNDFPLFDADPSRLDLGFLEWMTRTASFVELCQRASEGTTNRVRLQEDRFLALEFPLPALAEQRRIVARIEELAAQIDEALDLRRQSVEGANALVATWVSKFFREGPQVGWKTGILGDYVVDDCYGTSEKTSDDDSGTPILRMGNIQNGLLKFHELKYLHLSKRESEKLLLKRGDILVNRTNSAELVGKCAVFEAQGDFSFASYLIRLRLDLGKAEPHLVAAYINCPLGRAYMLNEKRQMTGQANGNSQKLRALPLPLPVLLSEQRRIVVELNALQTQVDSLKDLQAETAAELNALLPAILDRAFRGEL